jgi:hypothetical protein
MLRMLLLSLMLQPVAMAAEADCKLVIENHRFRPAEFTIPTGKKIRLMVENRDPTAEEFDSHSMNREKVIPGNSSGLVFIGPLDPGRYPFMGEFHADTAQGAIIAK